MTEWRDLGIVLAVRRHGEHAVLLNVLALSHGRHAGLVLGGAGRALRPVLLPGNMVDLHWQARTADQLGTFRVELVASLGSRHLDDASRLSAVAAVTELCHAALPERHPVPELFGASRAFLESLDHDSWPSIYVHWELAFLKALGFALDLEQCAATGGNDDLAYVSPRTGRAVSRSAGEPYHDRLLSLPSFLINGREGGRNEIYQGLVLTGHFIVQHVLGGRSLAARTRLVDRFSV